MHNKYLSFLTAATLLLAMNAALADGNAEAGKQKAQACAGCHGDNGISPKADPQPPILAGQYKDYIIQALHEYKNGERTSPIMMGMGGGLSEDDIKDLAEYFSSLPSPLHTLPHN